MSKKETWWLEKYSTKDDSYKKDYKSKYWWNSSYKTSTKNWMDKLGGYDWGYSWTDKKKDKKKFVYQKLLDQLQTSLNVIDCDKNLKINWSNGENVNSPDGTCVYLSPDNAVDNNANNPSVNDQMLDILTGKVYLAKVLYGQINKKEYEASKRYKQFGSKKEKICVSKLWESLETYIAKKFIEDNWLGFMPHVIKQIDYSCTSKSVVEEFIQNSPLSLDAAILGISWNLVHEHNPVEIPDIYDECIDVASEILARKETEENRFNACKEIVEQVVKIIKEKEEEQEQKEQPGNGSNLSLLDLKICDEQLFGDKVKNNIDSELGSINPSDDKGSNFSSCESFDINSLKNEFVVANSTDHTRNDYKERVLELSGIIQGIKNSFYFLNNKMFLDSYGHISGDIDENSLYKLKINDDRLMLKKDVISQKKISVCLLVDESGSMEDKYEEAINATVSLAEGLKNYFDVCIYGHTAETTSPSSRKFLNGCLITEYYTNRNKCIDSCMLIDAKEENIDGLSIELVAKQFGQDYPDHRKILFHISDGEPASSHYGGDEAYKHTNEVCQNVRKKLDIEVYGIGICDAFSDPVGNKLYGKENFVVLEDVKSSVGVITRFLKQICNKRINMTQSSY